MSLSTLKKRSEFMRVRGGRRWSTPAFLIECKIRPQNTARSGGINSEYLEKAAPAKGFTAKEHSARFGFIITKKLGNAVVRNRIRRRLKAVLCELEPQFANPAFDYVLLARQPAVNLKFSDLKHDMHTAFHRLHASGEKQSNRSGHRPRHRRYRQTPSRTGHRPATE